MTRKDPNHIYKGIRYDDQLDPDGMRVDKYLDNGWEIVSATEKLEDDRSTAPKSKEADSLRPKPITRPGKGGAQFVYMRKSRDQFAIDQRAKANAASSSLVGQLGGSRKTAEGTHLTGSEINENNSEE